MGNGASLKRNSLAGSRAKPWSYWASVKTHRMMHLATLAMRQNLRHGYYNLWSVPRELRAPWQQILFEASKNLQMQRVHAKLLKPVFDDEYLALLEGKIPGKNFQRSGKEVWVFMSSTFTDTRIERDLLMEDVYPFIRQYCRHIGLIFNVVDLRWGVRKERSDQHEAVDICMKEVTRCRQNSVGPYFVGIVGNKYGFQPIPSSIEKSIFEKLINYLESVPSKDTEDTRIISLLKQWYLLDTNNVVSEYILQPVSYKYPGYLIGDKKDIESWHKDSEDMQLALRKAANQVQLASKKYQEFNISITEMEFQGALDDDSINEDQHRHYFFMRSLHGFDEHHPMSYKYIDKDGKRVDFEAQRKLERLKKGIEEIIPSKNISRYTLQWNGEDEDNINVEENKEKLRMFCDQFCSYMVESIQAAAASLGGPDDPVYDEVYQHNSFCADRSDYFIGRKNLVETVMQYLSQLHGNLPFVIHGISGSGKTSIIAKTFTSSLQNWESNDTGRPVHIVRFLGTSPASSNVRDLLHSICKQLCYIHGLDVSSVPYDYDKLCNKFMELIMMASSDIPLMLFLDSLDQLSDEDDGRDLRWLPVTLPEYVHIVVSTRPYAGGCLAALQIAITSREQYLEVQPLAERDQSSMLGSLLKNSNRSLTPAQKQRVLTAYEDNKPTALYLKLATDIALKWKSYTDIADCHLAPTTVGLITQLFKELEGEHGEVFVSRALGYITAARNGLSANELLDILSCDDVVLDDVFQYQSPPVRRLPPLLWLRLKSDLGNYLVEGSTDDTIVYRWYHYLFIEVAKQRYLRELGTQLHQSLANYFMGRWAHSPKPYRSKQTGKTMSALRGVPEQPLILDMNKETNMTINKDGSAIHNKRYNLRTLTELPHHLIEGNMWAEAEEIMCNIPWLEAKCMIGRTYETCLELAQASMKCDTSGNKLDHFYKFMRANSHVLQQQPDLICQQALNQPDTSACCQIAKEYLREHHYRMQCWIDMSKKQTASPLVLTLHHPSAVTLCVLSRQCQYLAAACSDKTLRVWQVANGEHLMTVECDAVAAIFPSHHNWLVVAEHNNLKIFGMGQGGTSKGKLMKVIHVDVDHIPAMFIPKNNKEIHMVSFGKFYKFSSLSGKMLQKKELKTRPKAVCFSPDGKCLAVVSSQIYTRSCTTDAEIKVFAADKLPTDLTNSKIAYSADGKRLIAVLPNGTFIWNNYSSSPNPIKRLSINCLYPWISFAPNLDFIVTPEYNKLSICCLSPSVGWATIEEHTAVVKSCHFQQGVHKQSTLAASSSEDGTVRIWDTAYIRPDTGADKEMPSHGGAVNSCVYSNDGAKVASSSTGNSCWVWSTTSTPPKLYKILKPPHSCTIGKVACFSEDGHFVASYCSLGIDVWNLNSSTDHYDSTTISGEHRLLPYINPSHLFTIFNQDGLYSCFTPSNRPGILILYPILTAEILEQWKNHKDNPNFYGYNPYPLEFDHGQGFQITAAAMCSSGEVLASIQVPLRAYFQTNKEQQYYIMAAPEVILWDITTQQTIWRCQLPSNLTKHHGIIFDESSPVILMQQKVSETRKPSARMRRHKIDTNDVAVSEKIPEAIIRVFDGQIGEIVDTYSETGEYSHLFQATQFAALNGHMTRLNHFHKLNGWLLGGIINGVLRIIEIATGQTATRFVLTNTRVTAFSMSIDRKFAVVGCANGEVHFLRMALVKGNTL